MYDSTTKGRKLDKILMILGGVVMTFGGIVLLAILFAFPVMWSWNYVMPYLFSLKIITWQQAWCLTFLSGMFFKSTNNK